MLQLLTAGAKPDVTNDPLDASTPPQGVTPLAHAASGGDVSMLRTLLAHGADPNRRTGDGLTPLMCAAFRGQLAAARLLVEAGADPSLTSGRPPESFTATDLAQAQNHRQLVTYLKSLKTK